MSKKTDKKDDTEIKNNGSGKKKALRDFTISHNGYFLKIKKGDDLSKVPVKFTENLKTEKVL